MMEFGFLFWLFFVGLVVASLQDLKRREVDNWLNLFLLSSSFVYIFYRGFFEGSTEVIFLAIFSLLTLFVMMNAFYYGRVFAGGDAKLLFAMSAFFVVSPFGLMISNIVLFLVLLMFSGSIYGLLYSFVLYFKNFKKANNEMKKFCSNNSLRLSFVLGILFLISSFFHFLFLVFGILLVSFPLLFIFAKALENVSMVKEISGSELREGDWLVKDVIVGKKVIKANFEGLSLADIKLLKRKKKVLIKEGLPFVPAFLIAFLIYVFFKDYIFTLVGLS